MAWPTPPLDVEVSAALDADLTAAPSSWTWTVTSSYLRAEPGVRTVRGRPNEQSLTHTSMCLLTLDNRDGRFSPRNPLGAYYGQIRRNTPLRVRVRADPGDPYSTRFVGYVSEWPQRWDVAGRNFWVPIQADGVMRRLGQGTTPLRSALRRAILASGPVAYWPLEDEPGATRASEASGGASMAVTGAAPSFGSTGAAGAASVLTLVEGTRLFGTVPAHPSTGAWSVLCVLNIPAAPVAATTLVEWRTNGTYPLWRFVLTPASPDTVSLRAFDGSGTLQIDDSATFQASAVEPYGTSVLLVVGVSQNGADVDFGWMVMDADGGAGSSGTEVGISTGTVGSVTVLADAGLADAQISHVGVWDVDLDPTGGFALSADALSGFAGEAASTRFMRLCDEEDVSRDFAELSTQSMGPQSPSSLLNLLRECEAVDGGLLVERRTGELAFDTLSVIRYNQTLALTLDYSQRHVPPPLEPTDDDQLTRNDVTVSRLSGTSARVVAETGPLSVVTVGRYDDAVSLNVYSDDQLDDAAGWRVSIGTADELRWPKISVNLRRNPDLVAAWLAADIGSRIKLTNLPNAISYDDADLIIEGYTEVLTPTSWMVELNCAPYAPYKVFTLSEDSADTDEFLGRLHPDTCYSCDAHDADDTSWSVFTDPYWTETADDFPCAVRVGGEVATLTAVAPAAADAFGRSVTDGWGTPDTGAAYTLIGPAGDFDVGSGVGTITPTTLGSDRIAWVDVGCPDQDARVVLETNTTPVGGVVRYGLAARVTDSSNHYRMVVQISTAGLVTAEVARRIGGVFTLLRSTATNLIIGTNIIVRYSVVTLARADGTPYARLRLKAWQQPDPEPWVWTIEYEDESPLSTGDGAGVFGRLEAGVSSPTALDYDLFRVAEPKTWTLTRSVNGVVKSHSAAAEIEIDDPTVLAL